MSRLFSQFFWNLNGQLENLDWTLDWTFFLGANVYLGGGGVRTVVLFFLVCKKIAFSTFPQKATFFSFGAGGGGRGVVLYRL